MFEGYFKLKEQPFGASPDPRFLFRTRSHREALASLYCGFYGNRCFTALIAEPGMGKTTLLFEFLDRIRDQARIAFLFNTLCKPNEILSFILYELGVKPAPSNVERHLQFKDILAAEARAGRRVVVVIDEAHNLSDRALEAVRLLTNYETSCSKLLHVILAGQPELAENLAAAEAAQLFQRVSTLSRLAPFIPSDTAAYIAHRLKVAGYTGGALFTVDAIHRLSEASRGLPRIINTLCFNSLCLCRALNAKQVDLAMVCEAIADLCLPAERGSAAELQTEIDTPSTAPFLKGPEIILSSKLARGFAAAATATAICTLVAGMFAWNTRVVSFFPASLPTIALTSPQRVRLRAIAKGVGTPQARGSAGTLTPSAHNATQAAATLPGEGTQTIRIKIAAGDTLEAVATAHLGSFDEEVLRQIQKLNPRITDPDHIESGSIIWLPGRSEPESPVAYARLPQ